jgi:hypothetical protein
MNPEWTPMRWPAAWKSPASLDLLKGSAIDCLLTSNSEVADEARRRGLMVVMGDRLPASVSLLKGEWPGVRMSRKGGGVSAGPTGTAWVDTNGWKVRLEAALQPGKQIWVDAAPVPDRMLHADAYVVAFADSAAYGGRWVVSLDERLAAGIAAHDAESLKTWKRINDAAALFSRYKEWAGYKPAALVGVVSDFAGANLAANRELLNLLGRSGQQYRILLKTGEISCTGLRAMIYGDRESPSDSVRGRIEEFVRAGGLLITGPAWGEVGEAAAEEHPRYLSRKLGAGRVAVSKSRVSDPYLLANDTAVLISHRYDLVRLWNGGSAGSYLTQSPDGSKAVAHLLFYANEGPDSATVRIAGNYKKARLATVESDGLKTVPVELQNDAIEVHLPPVPQYVALELEA